MTPLAISETAFADTVPDALFEDVTGVGDDNDSADFVEPPRPVSDSEVDHVCAREFSSTTAATTPEFHELDFSALLPTRERGGPESRQLRDPFGRRGGDRHPRRRQVQRTTLWDVAQLWRIWGPASVVLLLAIASLMVD